MRTMGVKPTVKDDDNLPGTPMELVETFVGDSLGNDTESIFIINDFNYHHRYVQKSNRSSTQTTLTDDDRKHSNTPNVSTSENGSRSSFSSVEDGLRRPSQQEVRLNCLEFSIEILNHYSVQLVPGSRIVDVP